MQYNVKIDAFEGPLDLLLHLINRYEIDIYDIPVAEITYQYLAYIHTMQELQLDVASEYLVMAATLLAIKSKMLLPKQEEELFEDDIEMDEDDPREELMQRLIEYRKYKEAAEKLREKESNRALVYTKPPSDLSVYSEEEQSNPVQNVSIYDMLGALQKLFKRKKINKPLNTTIQRQDIPIEQRMNDILQELQQSNGMKRFDDLFPIQVREHIVVTFLAILELMKVKEIRCEQEGNFSHIMVYSKKGVFARES